MSMKEQHADPQELQEQEELAALGIKKERYFLWQLFNIEKDSEKANEEIEAEQRSLQEIIGELNSYENELYKKERELTKYKKVTEKREKNIADKENKIDETQSELLKLEEEKTHLNVKLKNTSKELEGRKEEKKKHMVEIENFRNDLKDLTEQLDTLQTNEEAVIETNKLREKKKVLDSEQRADVEAQKYVEENL
nr:structural maintenance of chromosomes protein 1 [Tanacetum cinerariifolium]